MRSFAGVLLVVAAVLKAIQFVNESAVPVTSPIGQWLLPTQIGVELAAGLLLLAGLYWRQLRWFALLLFAAFAIYSLKLALSGATSCGCFGPLKIHPWWTFILDAVVFLGLLVSFHRNAGSADSNHLLRMPAFGHERLIFAGILALSALSATLLFRLADNRMAAANGLLPTTGGLTILEPKRWIGQKLPIAEFIDLDLSQGQWIVLLHRHDCPDCQAAVPRYEEIAVSEPAARVALVAVPPFGESENSTEGAARRCRLQDSREWFVQTPVEIQLADGIITSASTELPAILSSRGH
jgi:Methylamine utilisation protein MauE